MQTRTYILVVATSSLALGCVLALTLLPAGRYDYWQGWALSLACTLIAAVKCILFADKKELIRERMHPGPGMKWWDRLFYAAYVPAFFGIVIVGGLDAGRFGWSPGLHWAIYVVGWAAFLAGALLATWAAWANQFFSSVVRIQSDRGQYVVQDGPYHYVRHPGYSGVILLAPGTAIVLGSLWGLVPAAITIIAIAARTYLEDTTLQRELPGYADYAANTRFRLLPGLW